MLRPIRTLSLALVLACVALLTLLGARAIDPFFFWVAISLIGAFAFLVLPRLTR